ncbi:hypothetical protein ACYZTX_28910 [Pseudomonas sp. MDT1-17]
MTLNHQGSALSFLEEMFPFTTEQFNSQWLKKDFNAKIWSFDFGSGRKFDVDFQIELENGSVLTDQNNSELLFLFKNWITVQNTPSLNQGVSPGDATAYNNTRRAIHIIDYLILNGDKFKLATFGLECLTENDVRTFFYILATSSKIIDAVYSWKTKTLDFFIHTSKLVDDESILDFSYKYPEIYALIDVPQPALGLSIDQTKKSKIWLIQNDYYMPNFSSGHRFSINTSKLASNIYKNTLLGRNLKTAIPEFSFDPYDGISTEHNAVNVRSENKSIMSERQFSRFYTSFMAVTRLAEVGINTPAHALGTLSLKTLTAHLNLAKTARYRTLRPSILLPSLQKAIDFIIDYGDDILRSAAAVMTAQLNNSESVNTQDSTWSLQNEISPRLAEAGVKCWSLSSNMLSGRKFSKKIRTVKLQEYFTRFRKNEGLWELLRVYYGAAQIVVGLLMARRQEELRNLIPFECLDKTRKYLLFKNGKSGYLSKKEILKRPIPSIGVQIIQSLQEFQKTLIKNEVIGNYTNLFAFPDRHAKGLGSGLRSPSYNRSLDFFCDYIETPKNCKNERFYIRQHQLRRGFSMMFFWGDSFGGLETLRWFFGHTDVEHLYNYITESTPGEVLRGVKSAYVSDCLTQGDKDVTNELEEIMMTRFGTTDFTMLDMQEVEAYLETLIEDNTITVEPHFLNCGESLSYQIVTKLTQKP